MVGFVPTAMGSGCVAAQSQTTWSEITAVTYNL